ncbi:MAG: hypothetical protein RLZZ362_78, partial [Actinomycetota bacterium]
VLSGLIEAGWSGDARRIAEGHERVGCGDAADLVLVSEQQIIDTARAMVGR